MSQWQPIETAPKDGSDVVGWSKAGGLWIYHWRDWAGASHWNPNGYDAEDTHDPTHWLPLPEKPE